MGVFRRIRGVRGTLPAGYVLTTPPQGSSGPAQLTKASDLGQAIASGGAVSTAGAAPNGVPLPLGSAGQVLAIVGSAMAWTFTTAITAVGTIATGVWHGTKIALGYGGTNADLSATGGAHEVLMQESVGANVTVRQLTASDISGLSGAGAVWAPLTNGSIPGPGLVADPYGQCIMVQIQ